MSKMKDSGFALDDVYEKEHTKKAGDNPGLSICGSPAYMIYEPEFL
jgi:hypothetical protein